MAQLHEMYITELAVTMDTHNLLLADLWPCMSQPAFVLYGKVGKGTCGSKVVYLSIIYTLVYYISDYLN